jgi:histidine triad (HIT) family protein
MDCVFCQIAAGTVPASKVFEDDQVVAFSDLRPVAPTHILVVPRRHVPSLAEAAEEDWPDIVRALQVARQLGREGGLSDGYRLVQNVGPDGGQTVGHLHWHLLGGRSMTWPPG